MDSFVTDLKYAGRGLMQSPGVAGIAVVALALGIGLTTMMFSIVYGALHRGLPFEDGDRIMHLSRANPTEGIQSMSVSIHDFRDWRERQRSFEDLGAMYQGTVNIRGTERAERYDGGFMTANSFGILGVTPILGRTFTEEEERDGAPAVVLLGHRVWQNRYGGSPDVLGQTVTVNGELGEIIGVMPEGFEFPYLQEVWVPLRLDHLTLPRGEGTGLDVFGVLDEGLTIDDAMVEFDGIAAQLAGENPETNEGVTAFIAPYTDEYIGEEPRTLLYTMLFTVILVLVIACANVANLLLARAAVRTRDLAIRSAMGADRWRVIRQMLSEAAVLAIVGAILGTAIAQVGVTLFERAVRPTDPPFWLEFGLDLPILAFVLAITMLAAVVAGIIPAVKASGADLNAVLKDESRGSSGMRIGRLSRGLVMGEIAMSMALLVASGLMLKSIVTLNNEEHAIPSENVFTARVAAFEQRYPDAESRLRFWEDVEERVTQLPGVRTASLTTNLPLTGSGFSRFSVDGESYEGDRDLPFGRFSAVTPSFRGTFEVDVVQGRWFEDTDGLDAPPVVVVNEEFVERYFPDGSALGRRIRMGGLESEGDWREIVGVVPNHRMEGLGNNDPTDREAPGFYLPLAQWDVRFVSIAARVDTDPLMLSTAVRDAVAAADADTPIYFVQTLEEAMAENTWFYRIFGNLFMVFGLAALFLASVGLYGVMSFSVSHRIGEMGVRMALGAQARQVVGLVLRQGLGQIAIGLLFGTGIAFLLARMMTLVLYQVEPWDPVTFISVLVLLLITGVAASAVPALRATRVDPMVALHSD
ncbi:MAG: ABC transporter permease [Gemmatimonadetes bacterium]|nr:ABC transporter permease [Gemmatimonadota bacterium]NNF13410.1 ABC transporter permease [Gemmatimonadota bacterium]NNL31284.1 ABC transporter permease [Gemmatimonadota bacterium]